MRPVELLDRFATEQLIQGLPVRGLNRRLGNPDSLRLALNDSSISLSET